MKKTEFDSIRSEGKIYLVDITLRKDTETLTDFIERCKREDLGEWVDEK